MWILTLNLGCMSDFNQSSAVFEPLLDLIAPCGLRVVTTRQRLFLYHRADIEFCQYRYGYSQINDQLILIAKLGNIFAYGGLTPLHVMESAHHQ